VIEKECSRVNQSIRNARAQYLKQRDRLGTRNRREIVEESVQCIAGFEMIKKRADRVDIRLKSMPTQAWAWRLRLRATSI
jgi:hypothetical protein